MELEFLWEKCGDLDLAVCHAACRSLYELVRLRAADFHFVVSRLLSVAPSAASVPLASAQCFFHTCLKLLRLLL